MAKKKTEEATDELLEGEIVEIKDKKLHYTIEEHDFKMESSRPNDIRFFDLYFQHIVNKGKPTERTEFKIEGYGIALKNCLRRIAVLRAGNADKREYKSFKEFANQYNQQVQEVKRLFDGLPKGDD